ncbi:MAG TPA: hypothetical protein VMZ25_05435 [Terriglobales bacterium]|nr:hypothetical protein [Terriglobales bacterium]
MGRTILRCGYVGLAMLVAMAHAGDPSSRTGSAYSGPDLQQITQKAGMIFLGRVERVEWKHAAGGGPGDRVRITLLVLDGIRGANTGQRVEVQEWSGLWTPGHDRYQPGETVFLFLYPKSRLGFTSPVAGDAGRMDISPTQRIVLSPERAASLFPRSLRLQKNAGSTQSLREQYSSEYAQFAQIVRELAGVAR